MVVIGLVGLKQSGKSTVANYLVQRHRFARGKFAGALKHMMRAFLLYRGVGEAQIERMVEGDLKEVPTPFLNGRTPRHAMQTLGTEWGRDCIHPDLWIDTETEHLGRDLTSRVLFEDVRFSNEVTAIRRLGGRILQVVRPGQSATDGHVSEQLQVQPDLALRNDGAICDLHFKIDRLLWGAVGERAA
jgi:hypothetical protein